MPDSPCFNGELDVLSAGIFSKKGGLPTARSLSPHWGDKGLVAEKVTNPTDPTKHYVLVAPA